MDDLIDKPTGYDIRKLQPINQSQLIDNDCESATIANINKHCDSLLSIINLKMKEK